MERDADQEQQAFYLPLTRFWELMFGAILAFAMSPRSFAELSLPRLTALYGQHRQTIHEAGGWLGAALIVLGTVLLKPEREFPGWWALLPALGAAFIIFAGPQCAISRWVLSHRAVIYIGLISYPLYLWHWPILTFLRMLHFKEPTDLMKGLGIAFAFVLAHLTYRYIEQPIRFGTPTLRKPIMASVALAAAGCLGLLIYEGSGFPSRFPKELQNVVADFGNNPQENAGQYHCFYQGDGGGFPAHCDGTGQPGAKLVMLWGDSHAAHLGPGLEQLARMTNFRLAQYSASGCPPIPSFASEHQKTCPELNELVLRKMAELKPDVVVMAGRWDLYDDTKFGVLEPTAMRATVARVKALQVKRVVVLGQFPIWRAPVQQLRARNYRLSAVGTETNVGHMARDKSFLVPTIYKADERVRQATADTGAEFVSPLNTLCNGDGCLLVVPGSDGTPIYWDSNHFTRTGSIYFVKETLPAISGH